MKDVLNKNSIKFLENYIDNPSPTGFESSGQKIWAEYIKPYVDEIHLDNYGTCYGVIKGKKSSDEYRVVIEAHADEISYYVNYITSNGLIYVSRNGGSDHHIAPSKRVHIHTRNKGVVEGLFGWPAIHTRHGKSAVSGPTLDNIFIDVGAETKEEVTEMGVSVGDVITYEDKFKIVNDRYFVGKSLDNKAGGFMIAEVARLLKENKKKLPFDLYIVNSVQEEIGLRGAQMIADTIKPHCAIITDVTHDTSTPMIDPSHGDVKCGLGPTLTVGPAVHNILLDLIKTTAEKKEIDYQMRPASRSTGTDTDAFAYSNGGTPSALISLPQRYMHTTNEMVNKHDVESVIKLIYHTLSKIKNNHDFKYFKV